jgi:signal transduction histidine kinase
MNLSERVQADVNILMVDDHPENLIALEAALGDVGKMTEEMERNGHAPISRVHLVRATSGPEALRQLLKTEFAVILLDVQMPGVDGYETATLIRQRTKSRHTPIIFLTAINTSEMNVFHGYSLGAVDYLFKPFEPEVLRAKVGVFIDLFRKKQEIQRMADEARAQATLLRTSNDELGKTNKVMSALNYELAQTSNELRKLNEGLEHRVNERTKELRETNKALKEAKETAEFANNAKDQFLAVLSHELRTPLTPVLAIVQMLDEDPSVSEEVRGWMQTIGRNVQLEARLIDDLLDLTRIANGKLQLHLEAVEAHKIVQETITICEEDIRNKEIRIELRLDAINTTVQADPARLQQVLWNILKNAVKFTPEGGKITVRTMNTNSGAFRCQVSDTGIGIPSEHLKRVFNAFDQGDKAITRRFGGLGLGLAISKALMEQHGGTIEAESLGTNKGATFTIEMPASAVLSSREEDNNHRVSPAGSTDATFLNSAGRLLLVEDNDDTSHALQILLERKGFTILLAHSVQSAVDIAKTYPCDLVISDIGLPDGTGIEVLQRLNKIRPTRGIAMSGFGMDEDIQRSLEAGFNAHLVKPISFDRLNEVLQQLLVTA